LLICSLFWGFCWLIFRIEESTEIRRSSHGRHLGSFNHFGHLCCPDILSLPPLFPENVEQKIENFFGEELHLFSINKKKKGG
jgi:hypothetical protein